MRQTKRRLAARALPLLLVTLWLGCAGQEARSFAVNANQGESVTPGTWGGDRVRMELTDGGGTIEFDCAHGKIDHKLVTESGGRFQAKGTYARERSGPEHEEGEEKGLPALYTGRTDGKTMTLRIRLTGSNEELGPFTLTHGRKVRLTKCM